MKKARQKPHKKSFSLTNDGQDKKLGKKKYDTNKDRKSKYPSWGDYDSNDDDFSISLR